jgi:glycosyltransferase involved in cell wall biosynthesis
MKILWTHNFDPAVPNSGNFMHQFANGLREFDIDVDLLYLGELYKPQQLVKAYRRVAMLSERYDVIHAQFGSACAMASSGARCRRVVSLRGSDWHLFNSGFNFTSVHSAVAVGMTRYSVKRYDTVIVMSHRMEAEVRALYPNQNVEVLPDPIDLKQFRPIRRDIARRALGTEVDLSQKWVLFTSLSATNPVKRVSLAKLAIEIASQYRRDIQMRVASGLRFDEMPLFVSSCDVLLLTSTHEGWPNCVKEALACNLPFVATDVSDLSTIAKGENSCIVCSADPKVLADGILTALESPEADLRKHVNEMDLEKSCQKLGRIYSDLLASSIV